MKLASELAQALSIKRPDIQEQPCEYEQWLSDVHAVCYVLESMFKNFDENAFICLCTED